MFIIINHFLNAGKRITANNKGVNLKLYEMKTFYQMFIHNSNYSGYKKIDQLFQQNSSCFMIDCRN